MQTKLIDGVPPLESDKEIAALIEHETDPWGGGGTSMDIAILSTDGRIYQSIRADGMGEYMGIVNGLEAIGLKNTGQARREFGIAFDDTFAAG